MSIMKQLKEFTIPFVGLKQGKHHFEYQIDNAFFEHFEYEDFNDSSVKVDVIFNKKETLLELNFKISGFLNINCDITNEAYNQEISNEFNLIVKFGEEFNDEEIDILILPHGEYEINIQQYIYEYIVLSIPTKRIHPGVEDGTLDSEILKKLEELSPKLKENKEDEEETDPRWNTLKKLLTDK
ncbi:DNA-binding protein [Bizionia arctica]|uniref:DNA-binding protein n=2 Tax=Bizionia arctica TaxID=1495645 RepID=A0A917GCG1_9FLAO|nr:DNA-binding protein [Bizionia arctica]